MNKHYIKINEENEIIEAFSDAFKQPDDESILYEESKSIHFNLNIKWLDGLYNNKYIDGEIVALTKEERGSQEQRNIVNNKNAIASRESEYIAKTNKEIFNLLYDLCKDNISITPEALASWVDNVDLIKAKYPKV